MGWAVVFGQCIGCKGFFAYNPMLVPSSRAVTGDREPVCKHCVEAINLYREKHGLERVEVLPGAYEEFDERDLA